MAAGSPRRAGRYLQQEGVAVDELQDPVRAGDEARQAQREHVVRRELLHHLPGCNFQYGSACSGHLLTNNATPPLPTCCRLY